MWVQNTTDLIILVVACEAIVQLWFHAAPLQSLRGLLTRLTPFLYSTSQETHLFDCAYCVSLWVGFCVTLTYLFGNHTFFMTLYLSLMVHRLSNFLHLVFSLMRDRQLDIRVARK